MKNTRLQHTHKRLTYMFTAVVFCIVMVIGISFLSANYFSENRNQKKQIGAQVETLSRGIKLDQNFLKKYSRQKIVDEVRKFRPGDIRGNSGNTLPRLSFFVLDSENNLVFKEILQDPGFEKIDFKKNKIYRDAGTFITTKTIEDKNIVFYQKIRYTNSDFISDILLLLFLASLLSVLVYFIGKSFVGITLKPVSDNIDDMSDFIHNAGHELKTPLAVIRGNLQLIEAEEKLDTKLLKKSIGEVDRANDLIEGLRELSEVGKTSEKSHLALATEIKKVVEDYKKLANKSDITIHNNAQGKLLVYANREELHILLSNVLKNAIMYNTKKGEVFLELHKNILTIRDTGVGMSESEISKIFERLYRGGAVRDTKGFGIGLSLVKKIVQGNKWKISVKSEEGKGSTFEIVF